jgi:hypothetical protein
VSVAFFNFISTPVVYSAIYGAVIILLAQDGFIQNNTVFTLLTHQSKSRDSSVGTATGHGLDGLGMPVQFPVGAIDPSRFHRPNLGPNQPPIQWVQEALSPDVKRTRCEGDHSHPSSAEVKNHGAIPEHPTRLPGLVLN